MKIGAIWYEWSMTNYSNIYLGQSCSSKFLNWGEEICREITMGLKSEKKSIVLFFSLRVVHGPNWLGFMYETTSLQVPSKKLISW